MAILNKDLDTLCQAPGIGKKTAERIVFELKDKIDTNNIVIEDIDEIKLEPNVYNEALEGLMSLGYSRYEVDGILRTMDIKDKNVEEIIREGLKKLSNS